MGSREFVSKKQCRRKYRLHSRAGRELGAVRGARLVAAEARSEILRILLNSAKFRAYSENARWEIGNVMFATFNLPANNNHYRIEANNVTNNDRGIDIDSASNVVIRNSAYNNGAAGPTNDYTDIVAGNTVGPIVDSSNIGASGNPHANYVY